MLYVAMSRRPSTSCRHANATFVATIREEVGPGVKMDWKRSVMKADMVFAKSQYFLTRNLVVFDLDWGKLCEDQYNGCYCMRGGHPYNYRESIWLAAELVRL